MIGEVIDGVPRALTPGAFRWILGNEDTVVLVVLTLPPNVLVAFVPVSVTSECVLALVPVAPLGESGSASCSVGRVWPCGICDSRREYSYLFFYLALMC